MRNIKYFIYLYVLSGFLWANAGSYEDFFISIKQDRTDVMQNLLARGFDVNTRDPNGEHALTLAIKEPSPAVIELLLNWKKTDLDARNKADESPLMMAALKGQASLVTRLVERGADVNKPGWAPLHYAATLGHIDILNFLLENHAYIDASSPNGSTPLMMAALYGTPSAVKLLLEAGADPRLTNNLGLSAIDFAQRHARMESAEIIAAFIRGRQPKGKW